MKIDKLIDKNYAKISVSQKMTDALELILDTGYVAVEGSQSEMLGIITLRDYYSYNGKELSASKYTKPHIRLDQSGFEVRNLMKTTKSDYLPVYDGENFIGVISLGSITDRLVDMVKQNRGNYQKVIYDVRSPIANIQGIMEIMSSATNDDERMEMLELSTRSLQHAMEILDDLLFVEMDENKALALEPTEVNSFLSNCVDEQNGIAFRKDIRIKAEFAEEPVIKAIDIKQFKRAVHNVLYNAIKFSRPGSTVKVSSRIDGDKVTLKIVDSGIGIPEKLQPEVFKKFGRAQRTGTNGEMSTGLGLAFTRQCLERHGGQVKFKSEVGVGTDFYITL